jgi:AraC family transcriptional regulator, transcriptional activator of pobA
MIATAKKEIPLLTSDSYKELYFHSAEPHQLVPSGSGSLQYFDMHNRSSWKKEIPRHRLDFYMVSLVTTGAGLQKSGLKDYCVHKNNLCFASPANINGWNCLEEGHQGQVVCFSDDFFNFGRTDKRFLADLPFFKLDGAPVLCLTNEQVKHYMAIFHIMESEYSKLSAQSMDILRSSLYLLLSKAKSDYSDSSHGEIVSPATHRLLEAFTKLYMEDIDRILQGHEVTLKKVSQYARELGVSQNHLNDTIKKITGKSTGTLIKEQLIKQATICLRLSPKSVSEIAYLLGFEDPSYFSRFFKKHTGKMPSDIRK